MMRNTRINFLFCITLLSLFFCASAQSNRTFECDLLSFEYPNAFKQIPIQNAPHMLLKLESSDYFFSISHWKEDLPDFVDVWDDEVFGNYSELANSFGKVVSTTKESLQIKNGSVHCMKVLSNSDRAAQGTTVKLRMLSYILIYKGDIYLFSFLSQGNYSKASKTTYPQNMMKGLKFKSSISSGFDDSDFKDYVIDIVKSFNAQMPIEADECTTYLQAILSGRTVIIKTRIYSFCKDFVDYDEFKNKLSKNYSVALEKPFVDFLDKYGYSILYMIYDESDNLTNKVSITAKDILYYY